MVEYLFQHGAEVGFINNVNFQRRQAQASETVPTLSETLKYAQDIARLALKCGEDDMAEDLRDSLWSVKKERQIWTKEDRVRILGELGHAFPGILWELIEYTGGTSPNLFEGTVRCTVTLLHAIAKEMTWRSPPKHHHSNFRQALRSDAQSHRQDEHGWTPLLNLIVHSKSTARMESAVAFWIKQCQQVGIDLQEYGRVEQEHYRQSKDYLDFQEFPVSSVQTFSYGSEPSDWRFWYRQPGDFFAGEFWHTSLWEYGHDFEWELDDDFDEFDDPWVPGAWVDVYDDYDYECPDPDYDLHEHRGRLAKGLKRKTIRLLQGELASCVHYGRSSERAPFIRELLSLNRQLSAHHMQLSEDHPQSYRSVLHDTVRLKQQLGLLGPKVDFDEMHYPDYLYPGWRTDEVWAYDDSE